MSGGLESPRRARSRVIQETPNTHMFNSYMAEKVRKSQHQLLRTLLGTIGAIVVLAIVGLLFYESRVFMPDYWTQLAVALTVIGLGLLGWAWRPIIFRKRTEEVEIPKDSSLTEAEITVLNVIYSASALTEDDIYSRLSLKYRTLAKQQGVIYGLLRKPEGIISTRQTEKARVFYLTSAGVRRVESGLIVGDKADRQLDHLEVRLFYPWYFFIHLPFLKRNLHKIPRDRRVVNWVTQKAYWMGDNEDNLLKNGKLKWFSEKKPYFSSNLAAWAKKNKLELVERTPMRSELRRIAP
jgi:hypothetical protein